jgi:D-threonate/D-erythronate kinase
MTYGVGQTVGIIADDLTGANDAVLPFFAVGCDTQVVFDAQHLAQWKITGQGVQAWAVNTQTRHLPAAQAAEHVRLATQQLCQTLNVDVVYKKMDSTLRGPVGAEALAVLQAMQADCLIMAPAYPQYRRRTVGGYVLLEGVPVEQTFVSRDLRVPVRQSHLPTLLQQQIKPEWVGHIELSTVLHGAGPIHTAITEAIHEGKRVLVLDACSDTDMNQIALAVQTGRKVFNLVPCGSAGLAKALSRFWQQPTDLPAWRQQLTPPPLAEATLIMVGSQTDAAQQQLQTLEVMHGHEVLILTPTQAQLMAAGLPEHLIDQAVTGLQQGQTVVVNSFTGQQTWQNWPPQQVSQHIETQLGLCAKHILQAQPANLVVTGGETAYSVCQALGLSHWELWHEVEPSIAIGWAGPQWMAIKPGHFGSARVFSQIIKWFQKSH